MDARVIKVFNSFKVGSSSLPILKLLCVANDGVHKTDLDRRLTYTGDTYDKVGLYEAKETVVIKADDKIAEFPKGAVLGKVVNAIVIDNIRFKALLDKVGRFVSKDTSRAALSGILLAVDGKDVGITATDGKRMYREHLGKVGVETNTKVNTVLVMDSNSRAVLGKMMEFSSKSVITTTITIYKEFATINIPPFELRFKCLDAKQYPNTDVVLKTERVCRMYEITGLPAAVKFLKQFKNKDRFSDNAVKLYAEKAVLNEGTYDKVKIREIMGKVGDHNTNVRPEVVGESMNPCLITLAMQPDESDKSRIVTFYLDYMKDVADILGDHMYMFYNEKDGYGYFLGSIENKKWV